MGTLAPHGRPSTMVFLFDHYPNGGMTMAKGKGGGSFRGRDAKTGQPIQIPTATRRPTTPSVPRIAPRTKASPKGR